MGRPLVWADNIYSRLQYPNHTITASEQATGFEAVKVGSGRRARTHYWTGITAHTGQWLRSLCDRPRGASMIAVDRVTNLLGYPVELQYSENGYTSSNRACLCTIPTVAGPGSIDDPNGVLTEEGVWLKRFPFAIAWDWRVSIADMGASLTPWVGGLYVGMPWTPQAFYRPTADSADQLIITESQSDSGWKGRGRISRRRRGTLSVKCTSFLEYDLARYHIEGLFGAGHPTWLIHDDAHSERAVLATRPADGAADLSYQSGWGYRSGEIPWEEHEALAA
jgi:hypothetical protein